MGKAAKRKAKQGSAAVSNFSLYLDPVLIERMHAFKRERGTPLVEQMRRAIKAWLDQQEKLR